MTQPKTRHMANEWEQLVERFCPPDKRVCNCGDAYYTFFPASERKAFVAGQPVDHWACQYGCDAAKYQAKLHVAKCVVARLPLSTPTPDEPVIRICPDD